MSSASPRRTRARTLLLWTAPLTWLGCGGGGGGTDVVLPALSITTSTQGVELDSDGYSLLIDGSPGRSVGVAATLVVEQLSEGDHTLELAGVAPNCAAGENPRTVTVRSGATTNADFAVTCIATSGSIEISTSTSGAGSDPDGYLLILDGGERGAIGSSASINLNGVIPGTHNVGVSGLAGNCQVAGENPRAITVPPGGTTQVPFTITCVAPGPETGTLAITTTTSGSNPDVDGYSVSLDGGTGQPVAINASLTLTNVTSASHRVELLGVAQNCKVSGTNPRSATVTPGQTTAVSFAVACTPPPVQTGSVRATASTTGSATDPDGYTLTVDGAGSQSLTANGSRTIQSLAVGAHVLQLSGLATNCTVTGANPQSVTVVAGQTATVAFTVTCVASGPSINLRIERMYLTQSTQTLNGEVPLVQGRDAYLRVFVTASGANSVRPSLRVRIFQNGGSSPAQQFTVEAPGNSTPTSVQEGPLQSSWNVRIPASLLQPSTTVLADVDPANSITETNETDNSFPTSGSPQALNVRSVPAAAIQFVPIKQAGNGLQGTVGSPNAMVDLAQRMYPLNEIRTGVHAAYTTSTQLTLQPLNSNFAWDSVLAELDAVRLAEGTNQTYFGIVKVNYGPGVNGIGYVGVPTALGSDDPADIGEVVAHELGHTWGRWHSPCGNPGGLDPDERYPYSNGQIGVYGLDLASQRLKPPSDPDIMSYCPDRWVSDYTYEKILSFRASSSFASATALRQKQPSLVVWGHILNGRPVLEPAFFVVTRPSLPPQPGPYSVEATALDGSNLFRLSFEAVSVADDHQGGRHFAFAVPLEPANLARLSSLRVSGPGGAFSATRAMANLQRGPGSDSVVARAEGESVSLEWNGSAHPMIMVRDPDTGEVLALARGGKARVWTDKRAVDLVVSDGVRSYDSRRAIIR